MRVAPNPLRAAISVSSSSREARRPIQVLHDLLKEAMRDKLLMNDRLIGRPGSGLPRGGPGQPVVGYRSGVDFGCGS